MSYVFYKHLRRINHEIILTSLTVWQASVYLTERHRKGLLSPLSFELSHYRILPISSTDSKVRTTSNSVINSSTEKYCSTALMHWSMHGRILGFMNSIINSTTGKYCWTVAVYLNGHTLGSSLTDSEVQ